jgi:signal transduction histidine kinase
MHLRKKILMSFYATSLFIIALAVYEYFNFIDIKQEIIYLEMSDSLRNRCLQLRRHEKNYFLYGDSSAQNEESMIRDYLGRIRDIVDKTDVKDKPGRLAELSALVGLYEKDFNVIKRTRAEIAGRIDGIKNPGGAASGLIPLVETFFVEHPAHVGRFMVENRLVPASDPLLPLLDGLELGTRRLRDHGEGMVNIANELDRTARVRVDGVISMSQKAILVFVPAFLIIGSGALFYISVNVAKRINVLSSLVEKTGMGVFDEKYILPSRWDNRDEIGALFQKFGAMSLQLTIREQELAATNRELLQSKKLAAIGTFASGVVHELNNPLNNIFLSAQVLHRDLGPDSPEFLKNIVGDILGQTKRVKHIVSALLEFARGGDIMLSPLDLNELITLSQRQAASAMASAGIKFDFNRMPGAAVVHADAKQLERVFINLFLNAADAMSHMSQNPGGVLTVDVEAANGHIVTRVSDTGAGISRENLDKVFEPFFTTKDKGTGLGLSIVYNIVKKHKGDIRVENRPGGGTTFTLWLPAADAGIATAAGVKAVAGIKAITDVAAVAGVKAADIAAAAGIRDASSASASAARSAPDANIGASDAIAASTADAKSADAASSASSAEIAKHNADGGTQNV